MSHPSKSEILETMQSIAADAEKENDDILRILAQLAAIKKITVIPKEAYYMADRVKGVHILATLSAIIRQMEEYAQEVKNDEST